MKMMINIMGQTRASAAHENACLRQNDAPSDKQIAVVLVTIQAAMHRLCEDQFWKLLDMEI